MLQMSQVGPAPSLSARYLQLMVIQVSLMLCSGTPNKHTKAFLKALRGTVQGQVIILTSNCKVDRGDAMSGRCLVGESSCMVSQMPCNLLNDQYP
jgi:hypothetical protein